MKQYIKNYWIFFSSLFTGVFAWLVIYSMLPVEAIESLQFKTISYIILCYIALILGFICFKFNLNEAGKMKYEPIIIIKFLLIIISVSYILRWIDLFFIRNLSFSNDYFTNRSLNTANINKSNMVFIVASVFKSLYFFPFIISTRANISYKKLPVLLSWLFLLLPLVEALLKGTRRPFFEIFAIVLITFMIYKIRELNLKRIVIIVFAFFVLMTVSMLILFKRESNPNITNQKFYSQILESKYNEILKPKEKVFRFFKDKNQSDIIKFYSMIALQTGQYITHGLFEFNHIINDKRLPLTFGKYTFSIVPRLINKTSRFNKIELINPSPREYVYLTAFGSFYIDFRWAAIPFFFCIGVAQKYIFQKTKNSIIYTPILILLLIINVFLLIFNYLSGSGIYPFIAFSLLFPILFVLDLLYEKSLSS